MYAQERRDNPGFRYEELVIALLFVRCLRRQLPDFELTSEYSPAGKFDDVVVTWRRNHQKYALLVQLKHKTSRNMEAVRGGDLFSPGENRPDFNISKYQASFRSIKDGLRGSQYAMVLSTNLPLHENAVNYFSKRQTNSVVGAELLDTGGCVYVLNSLTVKCDDEFKEHFFLFCGQKGVNEIREHICEELKNILGPSKADSACEELCRCVMKWKDSQCQNPRSLNSSWRDWQDIKRPY